MSQPPPSVSKRHVAAAAAGNALEFYDFTVYATFATQIGASFFPNQDSVDKLLGAFILYGVGFATRPLGALVLGRLGDKAGRRPAMMISFFLMGVSLVAMALCPSRAKIGVAAPVLVVLIRLVQGFALGGEVGPATAFLLEAAPPGRRALYTAMQPVSQNLASLVAGIVGLVLAAALSPTAFSSYGWRIAMLFGALVIPFGLWARRTLPETLHVEEEAAPAHAKAAPLSPIQQRVLICSIGILVGGSVATAIQGYLTSYAQSVLHMAVKTAFWATVVYGVTGIIANLGGALLADRYGRKPLLIVPRVALAAVIFPAFWLLDRNRDGATLSAITFAMTLFASTAGGVLMGAITESLGKASRSLSLSLIYAGAIAVAGGATAPLVTWLIKATGNPLMPAYYYLVATAAALAGAIFIPESAPVRRSPQ